MAASKAVIESTEPKFTLNESQHELDAIDEKNCSVVNITDIQDGESYEVEGELEEDLKAVTQPAYGYVSPDSNEYILSPHEKYPPDRGWRAWICVLGAYFGTMSTFGLVNVMGVFSEYYKTYLLKDYSSSAIAWITSIETFVIVFGAILVGPLYDIYGPKPLMIPGTIIMVLGVMMTSICTQYWQLILAQSLCTACGATLLFNPVLSSVSGWFQRKRAAAIGITTAGASTGGVILPILFRRIQARSGFGWAVRSMGFFVLGLAIVTNLCITSRVRPPGKRQVNLRDTYVKPFAWLPFTLTSIGAILIMTGAYVPVNYLNSFGRYHGFSADLSAYLSSVLNGASTLGRILPGVLADKVGRFNMFTVASWITGTLAIAFWIPIHTESQILAFTVVYGFVSGASLTVWQAAVAEISPLRELGARLGAVNALTAFGTLAGIPIGGAILDSGSREKYWGIAIFTGICMIGGGCFGWWAKLLVTHGEWLSKK
ncbi:major facilitator superfamily domain-containing protein [Lipomyces oligophaga]|uniref:major facilitator superfamily domain-containing protein n=1 Tax=Lipomyces oligophaga TaxID=45792 RepID=UPI0034CD508B